MGCFGVVGGAVFWGVWGGAAFWGTLDTLGLLNFWVMWENFRLVGRCWVFFFLGWFLGTLGRLGGVALRRGPH